jgi:hypothetical protein
MRNVRRHWFQYRLLTLLLAVSAVSAWLSWQVYRVEQQASAIAALQGLRAHVTDKVREPEWLWRLFGGRLGRTIVRVEVDSDKVEAAIPRLKALSDLAEVVVVSWPWEANQGYAAEALLSREMPQLKTHRCCVPVGFLTVTDTVRVPDGASALIHAIQSPKER